MSNKEKKTNIYFTGDIHGQFNECTFYLREHKKLHDCHVIVCGDVGMGFYNTGYYVEILRGVNKRLVKNNIHLYFLRGNHDNPIYFTDDTPLTVNYPYIHFVKDYEVLNIEGYNILCVGGATCTDKWDRREGISWWPGESVIEHETNKFENIDIVASHCAPMFVPPKYVRFNKMTEDDDMRAQRDRNILSKLYVDLCENNNLQYWFHGHYHKQFRTYVPNQNISEPEKRMLISGTSINEGDFNNGCKFVSLDMCEGESGHIDIYNV